MKKIILAIFLIGLGLMLFAHRSSILPEILKPSSVTVDGNRLYIVEGSTHTILVYSSEDFKLVKTFGKKGKGPGEFPFKPRLKITPGYFLVFSPFNKLYFFSRGGEYISEKRIPYFGTLIANIFPVGKHFVVLTSEREHGNKLRRYYAIQILDKDMTVIKTIARKDGKMGWKSGKYYMEAITDYFNFRVYEEKIYVVNSEKGLFIEVFDSRANKLYQVNKDYERIKVTDEYKKDYLKSMSKDPDVKYLRCVFKDFFPAVMDCEIDNGKIYVFTYKIKDKKRELLVMDLKGNMLKKTFVSDVPSKWCCIASDRYYYLIEDEDEEEWVIYEEVIK